jgi:hypothetical protein
MPLSCSASKASVAHRIPLPAAATQPELISTASRPGDRQDILLKRSQDHETGKIRLLKKISTGALAPHKSRMANAIPQEQEKLFCS